MAEPGSERATRQWLTEHSSIGELLGVDFEAMSIMRLYRVSDLLVRHLQQIESALFTNISDLFSLTTTATLYDLTNTFLRQSPAVTFQGKTKRLPPCCSRSGLG